MHMTQSRFSGGSFSLLSISYSGRSDRISFSTGFDSGRFELCKKSIRTLSTIKLLKWFLRPDKRLGKLFSRPNIFKELFWLPELKSVCIWGLIPWIKGLFSIKGAPCIWGLLPTFIMFGFGDPFWLLNDVWSIEDIPLPCGLDTCSVNWKDPSCGL